MPPSSQREQSDVLDAVRRKLDAYLSTAASAVERPIHAFVLARYLMHSRDQLGIAFTALRENDQDAHEALMRQAEIMFLTNPDRYTDLHGRADVVKSWTALLLDATEKLGADRERSEQYAEVAAERRETTSAVKAGSRAALKRRRSRAE